MTLVDQSQLKPLIYWKVYDTRNNFQMIMGEYLNGLLQIEKLLKILSSVV